MEITKSRLKKAIKEAMEGTVADPQLNEFFGPWSKKAKAKKAAAKADAKARADASEAEYQAGSQKERDAEAAAAQQELDKELEQLSRDTAYGLEHGIKWDVITPIEFHLMQAKLSWGRDIGQAIQKEYGSEKGYPKQVHIQPAALAVFKELAEDKGYDEALKWARKIADHAYELMGEKREVDRQREEEVKAYQARHRERGMKTRDAFSENKTQKTRGKTKITKSQLKKVIQEEVEKILAEV